MAVVVVVALGTAACGEDSSGSEPTAADTNSALTGAPIKIGMVGTFDSPLASSTAVMKDSAEVWAKYVNAGDGVNGHPVQLVVEDDKGDPALGLQKVKKLVEQDGVVAIVGHGSLVEDAWTPYVVEKGIPVIGGLTIGNSMIGVPTFFPEGTSIPVMTVGELRYMSENDFSTFGVLYCAENPVCASLEDLAKLGAGLTGGTVGVAGGQVAATAPNYQAQCLAMKDAGVDALQIASAGSVVTRVAEQCAKLGYTPVPVNQAPTFTRDWLTNPALDGAILMAPHANYLDDSIPGVKTFLDAVDEFAPDLRDSPQFSFDALTPFIGGQLFAAAATAGDLDASSTPADVTAAMETIKGETLDGLTVPLTYTAGQPTLVSCWFELEVTDGTLKTLGDGKPVCLDPAQLTGLGQALAQMAG